MVCFSNGFFIVLDDHHAVADISHALQGVEESAVVSLVQPDRGFVQNVNDPGQFGAHLTGETNPLGLAARERGAGTIEGEVSEPDRAQKFKPGSDFFQNFGRDLLGGSFELESLKEIPGLIHGERAEVDNAAIFQQDCCTLRAQSPALASCAARVGNVLAIPLLHSLAAGFLESPQHARQNALPIDVEAPLATLVLPLDVELLLRRSVQQDLSLLGGNLAPSHFGVDPDLFHDLATVVGPPARLLGCVLAPGLDGALFDAQ